MERLRKTLSLQLSRHPPKDFGMSTRSPNDKNGALGSVQKEDERLSPRNSQSSTKTGEASKDSKGSSSGKMNKKRQPFFKRKSKEKVGRRISEPVGPSDKSEHKPVKRNSEDRILHGDRAGLDLENCKWEEKSIIHREKLAKLQEHVINHPKEVREVNGVRVCCSIDFLIGMGSEGTRVYVGLGKDGVERAVKRLPRDACSHVAQQEKKVLIEHNTTKSNNVVRYWFLDDTSDREYIFLILDLCEETLDNFVKNSSIDHLVEIAPQIIQQILKGLADLHRDPMPILHRDVKPSNILRDVHNNWLLADFGISRILTGGASTYPSVQRGTEYWRAVESYPSDGMTDDDKVRYKKESDIQVAGMVAFYVVTKGEHPFGESPDRLRNLLDGKPVGLDTLENPVIKDLLSWMLSHDPKDRPSAEEAVKHPYLLTKKEQFEILCKMGNQPEIKKGNSKSEVVQNLNSDPKDWKGLMNPDVRTYLSTDPFTGRKIPYSSSWTDCLRLIRNVNAHWEEYPRPRRATFYEVGNPQEYFLDLLPNLPVIVHRIIRSCDWKERLDFKEYFI